MEGSVSPTIEPSHPIERSSVSLCRRLGSETLAAKPYRDTGPVRPLRMPRENSLLASMSFIFHSPMFPLVHKTLQFKEFLV